MNCPERDTLERLFESALAPKDAEEARAHAASCERCGAYLRRLEEEAESLRRNLPDVRAPEGLPRAAAPTVPARNPWKAAAFVAMAASLLLAIAVLSLARRDTGQIDQVRRNVQIQIAYYLEHNETEKAIGALAAFPDDAAGRATADEERVAIAAQCGDEQAADLLDPIDLAAKDGATALKISQARLDAYTRLFRTKILRDGAIQAPFEPEAYRLEKQDLPPRESMSRITGRLLAAISERRDLAKRHGGAADASLDSLESLARIARYALGEAPFESVKPADDEARVQFGDLLYREQQFDRAIETWAPVASDKRVIRRVAELAALRRLAPKDLKVWDYDVEKLLGRDPKIESEVAASVAERFRKADRRPDLLVRKVVRNEVPDAVDDSDGEIFFPEGEEVEIIHPADDPDQLYLLHDHQQFRLSATADRPFTTKSGVTLSLKSAYGGPIRARLYRVPDIETFRALSKENIVSRRSELAPVLEWETQFASLWSQKEATYVVTVPHRGAGLFVVIADARYCPVYAVAKFIVTDVALVQQIASDRILVFAADRVSGAPAPRLALAGEASGQFVLRPEHLVPEDDSNADEYRRGFEASWGGKKPEPDPSVGYLRGYQRATHLREQHPDVKLAFKGATDKDGVFEWSVPSPWQSGYKYTVLSVTADPAAYSRVQSEYSVDDKQRVAKDLVYSDRPIYRPGDRVNFKAMLRILDSEGIQPWDGREAILEFGCNGRVLLAKSCEVTDFGTVSGSFDLPQDAETGAYRVRVNNGEARPVFKVEEYRKPDLEIVFDHPSAVNAGQTAEVGILVRYYTGDPVANVPVEVSISSAPLLGRATSSDITREWYAGGSPPVAWRAVESLKLSTDASGRCVLRFATDPGFAAQYAVTVRATEAAGRRAVRTTSFEAMTQVAAEVLAETDRPIYYPGETAKIRVRAPGVSVIRIEERKPADKGFAMSLQLEGGAGSCEYVVPEKSGDLQIAVRSGEEWNWSPISFQIAARPAQGAIDVQPDKLLYRVGETAKIAVLASDVDQYVLVELATGRIHRRQVVFVANKVAEVPLVIGEDHVPNIGVLAIGVRSDKLLKATADILVPPVDRFLTVEVDTDKIEYRPGEECTATVRVIASDGRPVTGCEISLGVIDEAIYSLREDQTPDLREYFHHYQRKIVFGEAFFFEEKAGAFIVWKAPTFVKGARHLSDIEGVAGGGAGGGRYGGRFGGRSGGFATPLPPVESRADFRDSAFWAAHLRTNEEGIAVVSFPFPENLTSFRFTARGITRDTRVGEVRHRAIVRKPFFTRLAMPRVLQEGNTLALGGLVHNYTDRAQTVHFDFKGPFPVVRSTAPDSMTLAVGAVEKVEYLVSIDRYLPESRFAFKVWSDEGQSDGVEIAVPGHRHGAPFHEGRSGSVAASAPQEEVFRVPKDAIKGSLALKLNLDAGLHAAIIEGLDPLLEYPYGCMEQTMSRFMPAVAASSALPNGRYRWSEKLPSVVAASLQRIYRFQHHDGGWGWWERDQTNASMTSYILYGLARCKKAGVGVDKATLDRAAKLLRDELEQSVFHDRQFMAGHAPLRINPDRAIYALLALAEYESAWNAPTLATKRLAGTIAARDEKLNPIDEVVVALACRLIGLNEESERLAKRAEKRPPADVATASIFLQLQAARGGDVGDALRFILSQRQGQAWRTTIESSYAILGLTSMLQRPVEGYIAPGRVTIRVNDSVIKEIDLPGAVDPSFDGRVSVPEPADGWSEKVIVLLTFDGKGTAFYTAALEGYLGGEDIPPLKRGLEVAREYIDESGSDTMRVGREVLVHLTVTSPEPRDYVMVTDPRPDGFEPTGNEPRLQGLRRVIEGLSEKVDLSDGWEARIDEFRRGVRGDAARESAWAKSVLHEILESRRFQPRVREIDMQLPPSLGAASVEHRDDRTVFFLTHVQAGVSHLYYVARPEHAGDLHALAPQAVPMYEPEIFGCGAETRLAVADERLLSKAPSDPAQLPPGTEGLKDVIRSLRAVDADVLIALVPGNPSIGYLLMAVADERALRAWLGVESATAEAGRDLRERIEAARNDLRARMLAARSLARAGLEWRSAIEEAIASDRLQKLVLEAADAGDVGKLDNVLAWAAEDRAFRVALMDALQRMSGTSLLQETAFRPVSVSEVLRRLGAAAPSGDALVRWKLLQRSPLEEATLTDVIKLCTRDLGIEVNFIGQEPQGAKKQLGSGTVADALDKVLGPEKLLYRIRDGALWIGGLDDLVR